MGFHFNPAVFWICHAWAKNQKSGILSGQTKSLTFCPVVRTHPCLPVTSMEERMTTDTCSPRKPCRMGTLQAQVCLMSHTRASQLQNSSQHTLRSSYLAQGGTPSKAPHVSTMLKAMANLLIPILQLFKQMKST